MYEAQHAILKFEGREFAGLTKIMEKIQSLTFQKIAHVITAVDCQPTFDGGILINVLGQLKVKFYFSWRFLVILVLLQLALFSNSSFE